MAEVSDREYFTSEQYYEDLRARGIPEIAARGMLARARRDPAGNDVIALDPETGRRVASEKQ